jgi:hypothetical protein
VPQEIEDSMKETLRGIEKRNWKSCVVMCRKALQALMEVAYEKFFAVKPGKGLDLNGVIRNIAAGYATQIAIKGSRTLPSLQ